MEKIKNERHIQAYYSSIILETIFLLLFIITIYYIITPWYDEYKNNEEKLWTQILEYEKIQKSWLSFSDFSTSVEIPSIKKILGKIGEKFFTDNLSNLSNKSYLEFLQEKEKKNNDLNKSSIMKERNDKISKILPSYQEWISVDGNMTDLEFVNYVENILRSFRLITNSNIWIDSVVLDDKEKGSNKVTDSISSQIFYIPLKLEVEWAKSDILDFIYFLQNVGKIDSINENNIIIYKDQVINKNLWKFNGNNIYENKLVNIESIELKEYIDTSSIIRSSREKNSWIWLLQFIRNGTEKDQSYSVNLSLKFYVKGLPSYKVEEFIKKIIYGVNIKDGKYEWFNDILKKTQENLKMIQSKKSNTIPSDILYSLKAIETYLLDLQPEVKKLEVAIKESKNIWWVYKNAYKIKYDVDNIKTNLNEILLKINTLSRKK